MSADLLLEDLNRSTQSYGHPTYTFGPAGCVASPHMLRNEGERPTGYPEALEAAVGALRVASRAPAPLFDAKIDCKSLYFHL